VTDAIPQNIRAAIYRLVKSRRDKAVELRTSCCRGFDLTDLSGVDARVAADIVTMFAALPICQRYPDTLGNGREFEAIVRAWHQPGQANLHVSSATDSESGFQPGKRRAA